MNSYDIDGVIWLGPNVDGLHPGPHDVIVTGRSFEERDETMRMLMSRGIENQVYFNHRTIAEKTRRTSGQHKGVVLMSIRESLKPWGSQAEHLDVKLHFEDDPLQAAIIREMCPWVQIVMISSDLIPLEPLES